MADAVHTCDDMLNPCVSAIIAVAGFLDGAKLRLFSNNVTPTVATILANLTEVTTLLMPGYAAVALSAGTWGAPAVSAHSSSTVYGATPQFTRSTTGAGLNVYGWYCTDSGNTKLYFAARFAAAPLVVTNAGDNIQIAGLTLVIAGA